MDDQLDGPCPPRRGDILGHNPRCTFSKAQHPRRDSTMEFSWEEFGCLPWPPFWNCTMDAACVGDQRKLTSQIASLGRRKRWKEAVELFQLGTNRGDRPDLVGYSALISALNQWRRAVHVFWEMELQKDVISFSAVISACEKSSQWMLALDFFGHMDVRPNVVSYSAMISACEKAGRWQLGLHFFHQMNEISKVRPDVICYSAAISTCEKAGEWQLALLLQLGNMFRPIFGCQVTRCQLWS